MARLHDPGIAGQGSDPSALPDAPEPRTRSTALRLTPEEARAVRVAIRKVAAARGGYVALTVRLGIPTSTLYHAVLRTLAEEATARPSERRHTRLFLRDGMLKSLRILEARLVAAAPEQHGPRSNES